MSTALVWFRRDLRLADNPALRTALAQHQQVLPLYVHAPDEEAPWAPGGAARWWLHHALAALDESLRQCGNALLICRGSSLEQLRASARAAGASAVYWNRLYEPALLARDAQIQQALRADGLSAESHAAALWHEPGSLQTVAGQPYQVFTPYWRQAGEGLRQSLGDGRVPLAAPRSVPPPRARPHSLPLDALDLRPVISWDAEFCDHWQPGEAGAQRALQHFCDTALHRYRDARDVPGTAGTARISPHLHFGELSPLQCAARVERELAVTPGLQPAAAAWPRELGWQWTAGCGADAAPYFSRVQPSAAEPEVRSARRIPAALAAGAGTPARCSPACALAGATADAGAGRPAPGPALSAAHHQPVHQPRTRARRLPPPAHRWVVPRRQGSYAEYAPSVKIAVPFVPSRP